MTVYLDTQIIKWIGVDDKQQLSRAARQAITGADPLLVSAMVVLELEYLYEIRRSNRRASAILAGLGLRICRLPFSEIAAAALDQNWTRDPFDRLIVANAIANDNAALVTADERIRANYAYAVW